MQNHLAGLTKLLFGDKIYRLLKFLGELLSEMQMVTCLIIYVDVNKETQVQMHAQLTQISCDESVTYCNEYM